MEDEPDHPRELVLAYLLKLPTTIRTEMLLFVIVYAIGRPLPEQTDEFQAVVREYLSASGMRGIGALLCATAIIDHSLGKLARDLDRAEAALQFIEREHPDFPKEPGISFPLRRRHWEQARADWLKLRRTRLTAERLQDFDDSQLLPRRRR